MIGNGCMIGPPAATGKGVQLIGRVSIIGERHDVVDGLIHRWRLTENANDSVGTLHLTNNGSVTFSSNGASFNGSSQWLSCTKTRPTQFTMTAWVTPVNFSERRCAFCASDADGANITTWGMYTKYSSLTSLAACVCVASELVKTNELTITNYPTNVKTLMVLSYNGATAKVYRGASLLGSKAMTAATGDTRLAIGRMGAYAGLYWYGSIADVRLYSRALTADEIAILAGNGPNP